MIKIVEGNILDAKEGIICHQVNTRGVMGAGLARQIRDKYPSTYKKYVLYCKSKSVDDLLGDVLFTQEDKLIANIFGQKDYGREKQQTDYNALRNGFRRVFNRASGRDNKTCTYSVAIPQGIGCGLAGGDWNVVYGIIEDVFKDYNVTIYKLV